MIDKWTFYPFPSAGARQIEPAVDPQEYVCVGTATQLWTFDLDVFSYTSGCQVVVRSRLHHVPCDVFMFLGTTTEGTLLQRHGKALACQVVDGVVAGVLAGRPRAGVVACRPPQSSDPEEVFRYCGLELAPPVNNDKDWSFLPLPTTGAGPGTIASASFSAVTADSACVTTDLGQFTFSAAQLSLSRGCP